MMKKSLDGDQEVVLPPTPDEHADDIDVQELDSVDEVEEQHRDAFRRIFKMIHHQFCLYDHIVFFRRLYRIICFTKNSINAEIILKKKPIKTSKAHDMNLQKAYVIEEGRNIPEGQSNS